MITLKCLVTEMEMDLVIERERKAQVYVVVSLDTIDDILYVKVFVL